MKSKPRQEKWTYLRKVCISIQIYFVKIPEFVNDLKCICIYIILEHMRLVA